MKKSFLFSLAVLLVAGSLFAQAKTVESFEQYEAGIFPTSFRTWPFQRGDARQVYRVKEENGNAYLAADDTQDLSEQIFKEFDWKLAAHPYFKWRWRARVLPKGAAENDGATNDSACGVYIVFGKTSGTALKFTWSTTLRVGTVFEKKPGEMAIQVLDSGTANVGKWRAHTIDVSKVYQELLKHPVKREPTGFAILTDGNATHTPSGCDYDDFIISSEP